MPRFYISVISLRQFMQILCMFDITCDEQTSRYLLKAMQQNAYAIATKKDHDSLTRYLCYKTHLPKKDLHTLINYFATY